MSYKLVDTEVNEANRQKIHTIHTLSPKPYTLLSRLDLPKSYELEDWESEDDLWFRADGQIYNLNEFCTVGMPKMSGPKGGAQMASNGYFAIASTGEGEVHRVITTEKKEWISRW